MAIYPGGKCPTSRPGGQRFQRHYRQSKKMPRPRGRAGRRSLAGAYDLGGTGHHDPVVETNIDPQPVQHKRGVGNAAMQNRVPLAKKRGSNRSWSLMIGPKPNLSVAWSKGGGFAQTGGSSPWEEDTAWIQCRKKRVRGRRLRSGFTSDKANIGLALELSNANLVISAMH
jgi:hypothetical protein